MKVLLVAPASDFTTQLRAAFIAEGHELSYVDDRPLASNPTLWWLIRHVPPLRRMRNALLARRILQVAHVCQPQLALFVKGMSVKGSTFRALRSMGVKTANWFPENGLREPYQSWLDRSIGFFDLFFVFDSSLVGRQHEFPGTRIIYLPFGVQPEMFAVGELTHEDHERYDTDIVFVGAHYPEREELLRQFTQWDLKIFGWHGWERSSLASRYHGPLDARESAKAYQCAKVVINANLQPPVNGVNAKTFEICAAGGFQLTDARADLAQLFTDGVELVVFHDAADAQQKIGQYLADSNTRRRIAHAGHQRVVREHAMRTRVRTIAATL